MADWNTPTISSTRTNVLTYLKDRDLDASLMDYSTATNIPSGAVRANTTTNRIEKYNGSTWDDVLTDYTDHLTATSNPHSVAASDVGNTTAQWNADKIQGVDITISGVADNEVLAYDSSSGDWINQTATEADLATKTNLDAHEADVANPHSVTATQASALAIANNLSDVASASTSRSNLGLGSLATASTVNNGEWSGTDLAVVNGGTGSSTASGARSNLSAAASGANSDITSLTACTAMGAAANTTLGSSANNTLIRWDGSNHLECSGVEIAPVTPGGINIGTASNWFNGLSINAIQAESSANVDLEIRNAAAKDIEFHTGGTHRFNLDHSENAVSPVTDGGCNLGYSGIAWNGLHIKTINYAGTTAASAGSVDGYIDIQVAGVAKKIAYYDVS